jgi:predicted dehydrogenase
LIPADNWIQDRETGGGRIIGEVCHFVDTCMFLAGALPVSVFAQPVKAGRRDIPEEDNVNILITFANGSTAAINYFAYGNRNMPKEYIEVFSDNFAARLDNFSGLSVFRGNRKQRFKYAGQDKGHGEELKSFIHAVESGPPPVPPEELFSSTRVTFKILESLRHNTVVRV